MGVRPDSEWNQADVGDLVAALAVDAGNGGVNIIQTPATVTVQLAVHTLDLAIIGYSNLKQ